MLYDYVYVHYAVVVVIHYLSKLLFSTHLTLFTLQYKIYLRSLLYWMGFKQGGANIDHSTKPLLNVSCETGSSDEMDMVSGKRALPVILDRQDLHLPGKILHIRTSSSKRQVTYINACMFTNVVFVHSGKVHVLVLYPS